jgi:hypothetical protein
VGDGGALLNLSETAQEEGANIAGQITAHLAALARRMRIPEGSRAAGKALHGSRQLEGLDCSASGEIGLRSTSTRSDRR